MKRTDYILRVGGTLFSDETALGVSGGLYGSGISCGYRYKIFSGIPALYHAGFRPAGSHGLTGSNGLQKGGIG